VISTIKRPSARILASLARFKGLALVALAAGTVFAGLLAGSGVAEAAQPQPWQMGLQPANSIVHEHVRWFESFTLWIITIITLFVLGLLVYVIVKFNSTANPVPSRTSHNTLIEVVWTVAPILILVAIAIPSFRLLYEQLEIPKADMTVKATGYQWYWTYEYPELKDASDAAVKIESRMIPKDAITDPVKQPRMLAADYNMVVPVGKVVRVQVTAFDVAHAFAMPSMSLKIDGYPGRLNETWFKAERTGMYYGQCSELCGKDHAAMPIAMQVVTEDQYKAWSAAAATNRDEANKLLASLIEADEKKTAVATR
jgi:cytochrome c oxidase subunit 2